MPTQPPLIVIGSSGHAKVLIDLAQQLDREILFCTEVDSDRFGSSVWGVKVEGPDSTIENHPSPSVELVNGLGSIGVPKLRKKVFEQWTAKGYTFATLIHPAAHVSPYANVGAGAQIMAGVTVQAGVKIGYNVILNTRASIDHDCQIGNHVHIAPGATLSGGVSVGDDSHIGTGATVIQGITIGQHALVGAGATVVSDVTSESTVVGVPARPISKRSNS